MFNKIKGAARASGLTRKLLIAGTGVIAASVIVGAAQASVIDLDPPQALFGPSYSQDGFTVTNSAGVSDSYINFVKSGFPQFNANGNNATIVQNRTDTTNTLTQDSGAPFSFQSIGLGDVFNMLLKKTLTVDFTFNYAGGGSSSETVTLKDPGSLGLQFFTFDQSNLASVDFKPVSFGPSGSFVQFDFLGVNGNAAPVPEPATWTLMLFGLLALGAGMSMRRRQTHNSASAA